MNEPTIIRNGKGKDYNYTQDHCFVKLPSNTTNGELCFVEDILKPGFYLQRHYHKKMFEVFYILEGKVTYGFDSDTFVAQPGDTVIIPPGVRHSARCEKGGKMLSIFKNGQFDEYLEKLNQMSDSQFEDTQLMQQIAEEYDIYED